MIALTDGNRHFSLLGANGKVGRKQQKSLCLSLCFFYPSVGLYLQSSFIRIDHFVPAHALTIFCSVQGDAG